MGLGSSVLFGQAEVTSTALIGRAVMGRRGLFRAHFRLCFFSHSIMSTEHPCAYVSYDAVYCKVGVVPECA